MKQLFYLLVISFLISCNPNPEKKDLIGVWSITHENIQGDLIFTQDSAFAKGLTNLGLSYTWKINDSTIYYKYHGDSIPGYNRNCN